MTTDADDAAELHRLQDALAGVWSIERVLGRGGMGTVYLARDVALDRPVAIKVLHPALGADPVLRERFLREARTGARLAHPHIVPIYAVDERAGRVFFVMGLVDGETAGERLRRDGPFPSAEALRVVREIGWALAYAHAMGLVHRDVTLENILIERATGRALLADFGIAAEVAREGAASLVGTPHYLAPELIRGEPATPASDLYALAVTMWTLLSGRFPFTGADDAAVLLQHVTADPPLLARAAPATPARLVRAVEHALAKSPTDRPVSVEAWLPELGDEGTEMLARPLRFWADSWEFARPFYALGMSVTAMLSFGAVAGTLSGHFPVHGILSGLLPTLAAVALIHVGIELALLRRLARHGYRIEDLRLAWDRSPRPRPAPGTHAPLLGRVVNDVAWLAGGFFTVGTLCWGTLVSILTTHRGEAWIVESELSMWLRWAYVVFWCGLGFGFLVPSRLRDPDGLLARLRRALWHSPLAAAGMRLAAIGLPRGAAAPHTLHRPTELVLDLAIDDLWQALPAPARHRFAGLPATARALRARVAELKALRALLDAPTRRRSPEATALGDRLAERETAGIAALERLRLLLARLGLEHAPLGDFTQALDDARALELELVQELGVHASLRAHLARGDRPGPATPSPVPTPA